MTAKTSLFEGLPMALPEEVFTPSLERPGLRIERIVSHGQASPPGFWFDQAQCEWVMVLKGAAKLRFKDGDAVVDLGPGDWVDIPAHRRHRVEWTAPHEPTIWLAVFYD
jgi:cupin 2 domain-containing protein